MSSLDILIPTRNRLLSLIMALAGVAEQDVTDVRVVVSDQGDERAYESGVVKALVRVIEARGGGVEWHEREARGIAEQRDFLLGRASADALLFLDDDVLMEPWVAGRLLETLREERCGFVGAFPAGLSWDRDERPSQERIEYWDGPVRPEVVEPGTDRWELWQLHRAANLHHVARGLAPGEHRLYKVTWCAACVLYDREKLLEVGGFSFWPRLPRYHSGEEVLAQNLLLRRWGGCCIIPSGTYFSELPSTVLNPEGEVDAHALELLPELMRESREQQRLEGSGGRVQGSGTTSG
ncbi:MAG TPA: glycosyltransferase family A protein [Gemmatimonadaceae bacterium]|nr:glycosyltransferase family A protein [Gemmatimonadaceae bacterium]